MNGKVITGICFGCIVVGMLWFIQMNQWNAKAPAVGDTQEQVEKLLGAPSAESPNGGSIIRVYSGYEVTTSNNVVTSVQLKSVESEEERSGK